jgi:hypothetical protein
MKRKTPQPTDVFTTSEVARWLRCSERTVERKYPSFLPGRYLVQHVLETLAAQAVARKPKAA